MEAFALPIFRSEHIPVLGERRALPLVSLAGSKHVGDARFNKVFRPIATRLLIKCECRTACRRPSAGADEMVRARRELGLKIYAGLEENPTSWIVLGHNQSCPFLVIRQDTHLAPLCQESNEPLQHHKEPVGEPDQKVNVDSDPHQPCRKPREAHESQVGNR